MEEGSRGSPFSPGTLGHLGESGKRRSTWRRAEPRMLGVEGSGRHVCAHTRTEEIKEATERKETFPVTLET